MAKTKICRYCRSEIDSKATICPHCQKRQTQKGTGLVIFIGAIAVIGVLVIGTNASGTSVSKEVGDTVDNATITLDEYNQIENGMSVDDVESIVGTEGELQSSADADGLNAEAYIWMGSNAGSDAVITFSDGKVISKSQVNLK